MRSVILFAIFAGFGFYSCKKEIPGAASTGSLASLSLTNVVIGGATVELNSLPVTVAYSTYSQFSLMAGYSRIYVYPVGDSSTPYYSENIRTIKGGVYSLFLAGQAPTIDTVFTTDDIPYYTDSTSGVRFINLSPNSLPVNIVLSSTPGTIEFGDLRYKQITSFKPYAAGYAVKNYSFQVYDVASNKLLTTYALSLPVFHSVTLVLRGLEGGGPAFGVTEVNNY